MARISIDNGRTFYNADELDELFSSAAEAGVSYGGLWCEIVNRMDDTIREEVHGEIDPDHGEADFLRMYLERATDDLIIG